MKELADGTIRVQIDIDPRFKAQFHELFQNIDMPVALAPLITDFERKVEKPKGGALARLAGMWCEDKAFQHWITAMLCETEIINTSEGAADWMRNLLEIESRAELDSNEVAEERFHSLIRIPYMNWLKEAHRK